MAGNLTYYSIAQTWDAALRSGMDSVIDASLSNAHPILRWLAVVYIIVSFAIVAAGAMTLNAFVGRAIRVGAVVTVITSSGFYNQHVRDLAYDGIPGEIATVATGSPTALSAAQQFDRVSAKVDEWVAGIQSKNTAWSASTIGYAVGTFLAYLGVNLANGAIFAVWLFGRLLLAVVLCYGPWLLLAELFDRTRGWVDAWIGKIVGLLVFQLASSTLLNILMAAMFSSVVDFSSANVGIGESVGSLFHTFGLFFAAMLGMIALPAICAIGSGAAAGHAVGTAMAFAAPGRAGALAARAARASSGRFQTANALTQ